MQKPLFFVLLSALLLPLNSYGTTQDIVGKVVALRNMATATSLTGEVRNLRTKAPIHEGDTIQTGKRGGIQIIFTDNTIISLGRSANLSIHEYLWQPEQKNGVMRTEVKEGIFRVMGGAITKTNPEKFTTKTPAATIGIRGSMYAGRVSGNTLSVVFQGGRGIFVQNEHGRVEIPTPGHGTNVRGGQAPPPAIRFTPEEIDALAPAEEPPSEGEQGGTEDDPPEEGSPPEDDDGDTPPTDEEGDEPPPPVDGEDGDEPPPPADGDDNPPPLEEGDTPPLDGDEPPSVDGDEPPPPVEGGDTPPPLVDGDAPPPPPPTDPLVSDPVIPGDIAPELPPVNETTPPPTVELTPWTPPATGVTFFQGSMSGTAFNNDGSTEPINESMEVFANWHNNTIIGSSNDANFPGVPVIFFGKISGTEVSNLTFFAGTGTGGGMEVDTVEGTGSGSFTGTLVGTFNLAGSGVDWAIEPMPQTTLGTWTVSGSGQEDVTKAADSGTQLWQGYVVGLAENMNNINSNRHLTRNTDHSDFTMTINRDTGTVAGSLYATDGTFSTSLSVGGNTTNSAYVSDHLMGAFLTGSVSTGTLKDHGNYLISGPMDKQMAEYATWGYWEIAYEYAASDQYHNHVPGALWISGEPTSSTDIAALASGNVTGHYTGDVRGSRIDSIGNVSEVGGSFQIAVDFANIAIASGFSGIMDIDGLASFDVDSVAGPSDGHFIDGIMDNHDGFTGNFSGTLYGPNAASIGGNFTATDTNDVYQGIYGGNR